MHALFNPDGPFFSFGVKLFDIMAVSMLWAICCVPIVTIGPATSALYYVTVKQVRKGQGSLLKNYFGSFRDALKAGIPLTCIVLIYATALAALIWAANGMAGNSILSIPGAASSYLSYIAIALLVPLLFILPYFTPVLSRFSMGMGAILKLCIVISFRFFWRTILLLVLIAGAAILLWFIPYLIIVLPGVCALVCSFLIEPILREYMPKHNGSGPVPWYWQ